jgi:lipopolysaccharide transport system permease protein
VGKPGIEMEYEIKRKENFSFGLDELWEYRELLYFFVWRDLKVKYKQTALGVLWAVFQPLILMLIFTVLLGSKFSAHLPPGVPYSLFVLSGFLCWNIFSSAINGAGNSMVANAGIIKKVYFPRLIIPVSSIFGAFADFAFGIIFYACALFYYHPALNPLNFLLIPVSLALVFCAAFGSGTLISALNVKYRDFRYLLPFFVQALLFVSPVFILQSGHPKWLQIIFACNPMYAPLEIFRTHLSGYTPDIQLMMISISSNIILLFTGLLVFRKTESYFADLA